MRMNYETSCSSEGQRSGDPGTGAWPFLAAAAVFVLGFGALNILATLGAGQQHFPGLYTSRAATIGDGILLPLLAYALLRSAAALRRSGTSHAAVSLTGGVLGASAGVAVQVQALMDKDTRLDWTFQAPHSYNLPGWYHASFLVAACAFFGWAFALTLARLRDEAGRDPAGARRRVRSLGSLGVLAPGLAFLGLLTEDEFAGYRASAMILVAVLVSLGVAAVLIARWACGPRSLRCCALAVGGSLLPAAGLCCLFLPGHAASLAAAASGGVAALTGTCLAAGFLVVTAFSAPVPGRAWLLVCQGLCAAGPVFIAAKEPLSLGRLAIGGLAGLALAAGEADIFAWLLRARQPADHAHAPR